MRTSEHQVPAYHFSKNGKTAHLQSVRLPMTTVYDDNIDKITKVSCSKRHGSPAKTEMQHRPYQYVQGARNGKSCNSREGCNFTGTTNQATNLPASSASHFIVADSTYWTKRYGVSPRNEQGDEQSYVGVHSKTVDNRRGRNEAVDKKGKRPENGDVNTEVHQRSEPLPWNRSSPTHPKDVAESEQLKKSSLSSEETPTTIHLSSSTYSTSSRSPPPSSSSANSSSVPTGSAFLYHSSGGVPSPTYVEAADLQRYLQRSSPANSVQWWPSTTLVNSSRDNVLKPPTKNYPYNDPPASAPVDRRRNRDRRIAADNAMYAPPELAPSKLAHGSSPIRVPFHTGRQNNEISSATPRGELAFRLSPLAGDAGPCPPMSTVCGKKTKGRSHGRCQVDSHRTKDDNGGMPADKIRSLPVERGRMYTPQRSQYHSAQKMDLSRSRTPAHRKETKKQTSDSHRQMPPILTDDRTKPTETSSPHREHDAKTERSRKPKQKHTKHKEQATDKENSQPPAPRVPMMDLLDWLAEKSENIGKSWVTRYRTEPVNISRKNRKKKEEVNKSKEESTEKFRDLRKHPSGKLSQPAGRPDSLAGESLLPSKAGTKMSPNLRINTAIPRSNGDSWRTADINVLRKFSKNGFPNDENPGVVHDGDKDKKHREAIRDDAKQSYYRTNAPANPVNDKHRPVGCNNNYHPPSRDNYPPPDNGILNQPSDSDERKFKEVNLSVFKDRQGEVKEIPNLIVTAAVASDRQAGRIQEENESPQDTEPSRKLHTADLTAKEETQSVKYIHDFNPPLASCTETTEGTDSSCSSKSGHYSSEQHSSSTSENCTAEEVKRINTCTPVSSRNESTGEISGSSFRRALTDHRSSRSGGSIANSDTSRRRQLADLLCTLFGLRNSGVVASSPEHSEGAGSRGGETVAAALFGGRPVSGSKQDLRSMLSTLVLATFNSTQKDTRDPDTMQCAICLEEFIDNDLQVFLPCFHIYHHHCILRWFQRVPTCPVCQTNVWTLMRTSPEPKGHKDEEEASDTDGTSHLRPLRVHCNFPPASLMMPQQEETSDSAKI